MAGTVALRAFAVVFWNAGLAQYEIVGQDGGFAGVATTGPGECVLSLQPDNFAGVVPTIVHVSPTVSLAAGSSVAFSAEVENIAGVPTGNILVTSLQEQPSPAPSALAGVSFRIDIEAVASPTLG